MINIGLIGASGRMGSEIISQILLHDNLNLSVACVTDSDKFLNCPVKTQILTFINDTLNFTSSIENVFQNSDLIIDFSSPIALNEALNINCKYKKPFFSGTTPMNEEIKNKINELSRVAKICHASNTSLGINLIKKICENLGYVLKDYDCEILEKHHSKKKDAPSGTSILLGEYVAKGRNVELNNVANFSRNTSGERKANEIGFSSIRGGNIFGEHDVMFMNEDEMISISHIAYNRKIFAKNALKFAIKLFEKQEINGLFDINMLI